MRFRALGPLEVRDAWGATDAATVLHTWAQWCRALLEQATTAVAVLQLPPLPGVPEPLAGRMTVAVRFAWTADAALPAEAVDALLAVAGPGSGSPQVIVELRQLGAALARAPQVPSALCHRDAAYVLNVIGVPVPPLGDAVATHGEAVRRALAPWTTGGALPNHGAGTGPERLARSYDPATLARLTELAERYDPSAVLRAGQVPTRTRVSC